MSKVHELKGLSAAIASGQVESIVDTFNKFDEKDDGTISSGQLKEVLSSLGLTEGATSSILAAAEAADFCKDESINYEDFAKWLCGSGIDAARMRGLLTGVCWPGATIAALRPSGSKPEEVKVGGPTPCIGKDRVTYWEAGGPSKVRIRVLEDDAKLLKLGDEFTVGLRFRVAELKGSEYDTLLMGHDGKHWLAVECSKRRFCCADGKSKATSILDHTIPLNEWVVVFLQPRGDQTVVFTNDADGFLEAGVFEMALKGSKLDKMGWAENEVHIAEVMLWPRVLSWSEMASALPATPTPELPKLPKPPRPRSSFRGQVVDTSGGGVPDVQVKWGKTKSAVTDDDGCFAGELSDAETDVPDDAASVGSGGSTWSTSSVISFRSEGFAPAIAHAQCTLGGPEASLRVTMRPSVSAVLDLAAGGSVVDEATGSSIKVPPHGLVYPDGSPVEGLVTVSFSVIDVTDPAALASMPGDFSAVGADGSTVYLQSLGAAWVGATDEKGNQLAVKEHSEGLELDLKSNATADMEKLDTTVEMWTFNEDSGKWELETTQPMKVNGEVAPNSVSQAEEKPRAKPREKKKARQRKDGTYEEDDFDREAPPRLGISCMSPEAFRKAVGKMGQKTLSTKINKLGYINCDIAYQHPLRAVMLQGVVLDASRKPLTRIQLWAVGRDYQGRCSDVTKEEGKFLAMIAQFDSDVDVEVHWHRPAKGDERLALYFENHLDWCKLVDKETKEVMRKVGGNYKKGFEELVWYADVVDSKSEVAWIPERRQWQHTIDGKLVFLREAEDESGGPFCEDGWRMAPSFAVGLKTPIPPPIYARPTVVHTQTFGPFKTGPPGKFVDVGVLVLT